MRVTDERSNSAKRGDSMMRHMIVGTPPIDVTFSSWMIRIASSGSKRPGGISTSLAPAA